MTNDRDQKSWRALLGQHGPALLLLARQLCRSHADAQDALQDGFVRFWKSRDRANDPIAYLFACVRSAVIDLSRSGQRRRSYETDAATPQNAGSIFDAMEQEELAQAVQAALQTLPTEQREVLVLKIWGELTFTQIATTLEIKPDTAASRYRYALARLQTALKQEVAHE